MKKKILKRMSACLLTFLMIFSFTFANVVQVNANSGQCQSDTDVVLIVDRSGTMIGNPLAKAKVAANNFLGLLSDDDQSAVVSFSSNVVLENGLTINHAVSQANISNLQGGGLTNIGGAIAMANTLFPTGNTKTKVEILITDGRSNIGPNPLDKSVEATALGIKIYTIGLGNNVDVGKLQQIASNTGGQYYPAATPEDLDAIYDAIRWQLCQLGSISGYKYETDPAGNNQATVPGWEIALDGDTNATQSTDGNGYFKFSGLLPGPYVLSEGVNPGIYEQTYPTDNNGTYIIDLLEGEHLTRDFGNYLPSCGNDELDSSLGEECDDGNNIDGDGCSASCLIEPQCSDGQDNDQDTFIDSADPGCWTDINDPSTYNPQDNDETNDALPQCSDYLDNDQDGDIDVDDSTCYRNGIYDGSIDDEQNKQPIITITPPTITLPFGSSFDPMDYGIADDHEDGNITGSIVVSGDTVDTSVPGIYYVNYDVIDSEGLAADQKTLEVVVEESLPPIYECNDEIDNDGDGYVDYPEDKGCDSAEDDDEYDAPEPYCGDGTCNGDETCSTCPDDCEPCYVPPEEPTEGGGSVPPAVTYQTDPICSVTPSENGKVEIVITADTSKPTDFRIVCDPEGHNPSWGEEPDYGYAYYSDLYNVYPSEMTRQHSAQLILDANVGDYYCLALANEHYSGRKEIRAEVFCEVPEVKGVEAPIEPQIEAPVCNYLLEYIKLGAKNNPVEVEKLETFLNIFEGESLAINGSYEKVDFNAVSRFQEKYRTDVLDPWGLKSATGFVYITTKKKVNELYCKREFPLTLKQEKEINKYKK